MSVGGVRLALRRYNPTSVLPNRKGPQACPQERLGELILVDTGRASKLSYDAHEKAVGGQVGAKQQAKAYHRPHWTWLAKLTSRHADLTGIVSTGAPPSATCR